MDARDTSPHARPDRVRLVGAVVLTGVAAGLAGAAITLLLHGVQHLAFGYSEDTFLYGVEQAAGARRVVAVALGGLVAGLGWWAHRRRVTSEAVSVTHALRCVAGPVDPVVGPPLPPVATSTDALLQIVAVGAGASLGREGAPRQVGAAAGLWIASRLGLGPRLQRSLLAAGAGAGLAAVYNVPLGGALFTLEVLLGSWALPDVLVAAVTSAIATVIAWPVLGHAPTYVVPPAPWSTAALLWAVPAGPLLGLAGVGFVRLTTAARVHARTGATSVVAIPVVFAGLGLLAIAYPQLLGNGKGPAELALTAGVTIGTAAALAVLKPIATAVCLGAGAIGGLLTPSFATGALLGLVLGRAWAVIAPGTSLATTALVGAACLLAVTQRAPLTALALSLEFVDGGPTVLPAMVVAVALAVATAHRVAGIGPVRRARAPGTLDRVSTPPDAVPTPPTDGCGRLRAAAAAESLTLRDDAMSLAELDGLLSAWRQDDVERPWLADEVASYVALVLATDVPGASLQPDDAVRLADGSVLDVRAITAERLTRPSTDLRGVVREAHARPARRRRWWRRG